MMSGDASRAVDHDAAGHFDISDPLGVSLLQLKKMCEDGNGFAAWLAYRLCRASGRGLPDWIATYLDEAAAFLLDSFHRGDTQGRILEKGLKLNAVKTQRDEALSDDRWRAIMQQNVEALLPRLVDDYAVQKGLPTQTAIRQLAPALGYPGEQWHRLRDAYNRALERQRKSE